ncbi:hypothetical protein AGMMS50212_08460 [Spirochaetia bacterium]|nr:hypothetical protein AGMMS50212_08460 [Spirochaetia bacterium]
MEALKRELSGEEISEAERAKRSSIVGSIMNKDTLASEKAEADRINAIKRIEATDKFLKNSGIAFGGWIGPIFDDGPKSTYIDKDTGKETTSNNGGVAGGGHIELRMSHYFGIQTGISGFKYFASYTPPDGTKQYVELNSVQIPIIARVNFRPPSSHVVGIQLSGYAGVGMNVSTTTSDAKSVDPAIMNFIAGGELGAFLGIVNLSIGYQWNGYLSNGTFTVDDAKYDYKQGSNILTFALGFYLPFRRSN